MELGLYNWISDLISVVCESMRKCVQYFNLYSSILKFVVPAKSVRWGVRYCLYLRNIIARYLAGRHAVKTFWTKVHSLCGAKSYPHCRSDVCVFLFQGMMWFVWGEITWSQVLHYCRKIFPSCIWAMNCAEAGLIITKHKFSYPSFTFLKEREKKTFLFSVAET